MIDLDRHIIENEEKLLSLLDKRNESHFYIKVSICYWNDENGLHMRKDIRVLKRKSPKGTADWFYEDCSMGGADKMFKYFKDLDEGEYKVTIREYRDWETGYIDDWDYKAEKI